VGFGVRQRRWRVQGRVEGSAERCHRTGCVSVRSSTLKTDTQRTHLASPWVLASPSPHHDRRHRESRARAPRGRGRCWRLRADAGGRRTGRVCDSVVCVTQAELESHGWGVHRPTWISSPTQIRWPTSFTHTPNPRRCYTNDPRRKMSVTSCEAVWRLVLVLALVLESWSRIA
jgi:hypothetical protein